jgi:hypothetical protein
MLNKKRREFITLLRGAAVPETDAACELWDV